MMWVAIGLLYWLGVIVIFAVLFCVILVALVCSWPGARQRMKNEERSNPG